MITANVIHSEDSQGMNNLIYPDQSYNAQNYLYRQLGSLSENITEQGRMFLERARETADNLYNSELAQRARNAVRMATGYTMDPNAILYYNDLEQMRAATPVMQDYLMANPVVRDMYQNQRCDGWSETYVDSFKGDIGENHYPYRRVMDGIVDIDSEDGTWKAVNYYDELMEQERDLDFFEKVRILDTWEVMNLFVDQKKDPTDPLGGEL